MDFGLEQYYVELGYIAVSLFIAHRMYIIADLWRKKSLAMSWLKVRARVMDARVVERNIETDRMYRKSLHLFFARFRYNSKLYGADRISLYRKRNMHESRVLKDLIDSGAKYIDIYINPEEPYRSVLLPPKDHLFLWDVLKLAFFLVGMSLLYIYQTS